MKKSKVVKKPAKKNECGTGGKKKKMPQDMPSNKGK